MGLGLRVDSTSHGKIILLVSIIGSSLCLLAEF